MGERVGGLLSGRTSPGSHGQRVRGRQGGLAKGCWGVRADVGGPRRRGFALDWPFSGKGRGRLPSGVFTNLICPGRPPPARPQLLWARQQAHV